MRISLVLTGLVELKLKMKIVILCVLKKLGRRYHLRKVKFPIKLTSLIRCVEFSSVTRSANVSLTSTFVDYFFLLINSVYLV